MNKFDLHQNVSTHLAFLLILVISFAVALYTVSASGKIVNNAKQSPGFDIEKRETINGIKK